MSAGQYIDEYEKEQAKEKLDKLFESKIFSRLINNLMNDLTYFCENYYAEESKLPNMTKDTFYTNIIKLLDDAKESYIEEMVGSNESIKLMTTYEIVEYIKKFIERSQN